MLTIECPSGYRFDTNAAEVLVRGNSLPAKLSRSTRAEVRLGPIDSEDVYVNLPVRAVSALGQKSRAKTAAHEFQIRLDYENDGVTDWNGHAWDAFD